MKECFQKRTTPKNGIHYLLHISKRRRVAIIVSNDGSIHVNAPPDLSTDKIDQLIDLKNTWIIRRLSKIQNQILLPVLLPGEQYKHAERLRKRAADYLQSYNGQLPKRVFIRCCRSRWGSCSSLGNISLNCYLDLLPQSLFEYVICHELTHLAHMNHSGKFWAELADKVPEPKIRRKELSVYSIPNFESNRQH
jgi:hypothetical protein